MTNEQIREFNSFLSSKRIKSDFFNEILENHHHWNEATYKYLSQTPPLFAITAAFPIDKCSLDEKRLLEINEEWIGICIEKVWYKSSLEDLSVDDVMSTMNVFFGPGMTNNGYSPAIDHKNFTTAIKVVQFALSTGFWDGNADFDGVEKMRAVIKTAIEKRKEEEASHVFKVHNIISDTFDEFESKSRRVIEEARKAEERKLRAEEALRLKKEKEEREAIQKAINEKNEEIRNVLNYMAGQLRLFINNLNWEMAGQQVIAIANSMNEYFKVKDGKMVVAAAVPEEVKEQPVVEDTSEEEPAESADKKRYHRMSHNQLSLISSCNIPSISINSKLSKFLEDNGYKYSYVFNVEDKIFLQFTKADKYTGCKSVITKKTKSNLAISSASSAAMILSHFNQTDSCRGMITISENKSSNPDVRRFELLSYEPL